jgi:hypothetical protein
MDPVCIRCSALIGTRPSRLSRHGDNVLFANLIHFSRQFVRNFLEANWEDDLLSYILHQLLIYNVQYTLPALQHDFCGLWNEIVLKARDRDYHLLSCILGKIHPIYVALHRGHTQYDRYQLCSIFSHRIYSASNLSDVDGDRTSETARVPIATSPTLHHHDAIPSVTPPFTEYDTPPPPSASNLDHAILHMAVDGQSRNGVLDNITPGASSLYPAPLENGRLSGGTAAACRSNTTSLPTRNMTTPTPSFVPDTVPPPIPLLTGSPDPPVPRISADPLGNQSGCSPDDGSISLSSFQMFTPFTPQVISGFDSNTTTEIGLLDAPDDTLDPNRHVMSQSFTPPSRNVAQYSLRPEDGDSSETSGPSR